MGNVPKRQKPDHRKKKTTAEGHQQCLLEEQYLPFNNTTNKKKLDEYIARKCFLSESRGQVFSNRLHTVYVVELIYWVKQM